MNPMVWLLVLVLVAVDVWGQDRWARSGDAQAVCISARGVNRVWLNQVPTDVLARWGVTREQADAAVKKITDAQQADYSRKVAASRAAVLQWEKEQGAKNIIGTAGAFTAGGVVVRCADIRAFAPRGSGLSRVGGGGGVSGAGVHSPEVSGTVILVGWPGADKAADGDNISVKAQEDGVVEYAGQRLRRWKWVKDL